ncbi:MAG: hypothetical protein GY862_13620 [Gammaproteobacteria bacterium]|nr:hypothetical protein [Gammaproteobacteria bacterium]
MMIYKAAAVLFMFAFIAAPHAEESRLDWIYDWTQEKFYVHKRKLADSKLYIRQQRQASRNAELYHKQSAFLSKRTKLANFKAAERRYAKSKKLNDDARVLFEKGLREIQQARSAASQARAHDLEFVKFAKLSDRRLKLGLRNLRQGMRLRKQENDPFNIGNRHFNVATDKYRLIFDEKVIKGDEEGEFMIKKHRKFIWK